MSVWKKISQEDITVTPYNAHKDWYISGSVLSDYGVDFLLGSASNGNNGPYYLNSNDIYDGVYHTPLTYRSLQQLYYRGYNSTGGLDTTSSYDNYIESSFSTSSRAIGPQQMIAISIPRSVFGTYLQPGSFVFGNEDNVYMVPNYTVSDYFEEGDFLIDDAEGNLTTLDNTSTKIGNIIYSHGVAIITDNTQVEKVKNTTKQDLRLKSNLPIYFYNYSIRVEETEFNTTFNPTAQTGSYLVDSDGEEITDVSAHTGSRFPVQSGLLADNITGSAFTPYITTVGLYNDALELLAVAKLGKPLPKTKDMDITIKVKLDS